VIEVLGHWELGYHAPVTEQYYWSLPLRDFNVSGWNMVPVSGIKNREQQVNLVEWGSYDDYFRDNNLKRVFIEPRTKHQNPETTWLHEYKHPEDCVYVFGSAHYNPTLKYCRKGDDVVSIKTKHDKGVFWAEQAMCIVLYERAKQWP
jgi:hypothetical protein